MSEWDKPILPPRLPGAMQPPKPMPAGFAPVMRMATMDTAAHYGVSRAHANRWYRQWLKLPAGERGTIMLQGITLQGEGEP